MVTRLTTGTNQAAPTSTSTACAHLRGEQLRTRDGRCNARLVGVLPGSPPVSVPIRFRTEPSLRRVPTTRWSSSTSPRIASTSSGEHARLTSSAAEPRRAVTGGTPRGVRYKRSTAPASAECPARWGRRAAASRTLAGVVRISELQAGHIDHALGFVSHYTCKYSFRYPAVKTDGRRILQPCIPREHHSARSVDQRRRSPASHPASASWRTRCRPTVRTATTRWLESRFAFESPIDGQPAIYRSVGFRWDYWNMPHIPWTSLRVRTGRATELSGAERARELRARPSPGLVAHVSAPRSPAVGDAGSHRL